jgi:hypothetical protein
MAVRCFSFLANLKKASPKRKSRAEALLKIQFRQLLVSFSMKRGGGFPPDKSSRDLDRFVRPRRVVTRRVSTLAHATLLQQALAANSINLRVQTLVFSQAIRFHSGTSARA